jgi:riboflavin synthase
MFTGLVEEIGSVKGVSQGAKSSKIHIKAKDVLSGLKLGDSISTNGVCLTVVEFNHDSFHVDVMPQTMRHTNLSSLGVGSLVNLERALRLGDRLGGHLVSGHIDDLGTLISIRKEDNAIWYTISAPPSILRYIIPKGSVALDGISLTVADVMDDSFAVSIIPHTQKETTLNSKKVGDSINVECDQIGKYIARLMNFSDHSQGKTNTNSSLNIDFLRQNGFID